MTLRELLDQGYRLKPWLEAEDYLIDYDAEVPEHGCDHENKIIGGVRVKQNYKPISFVLQYIFKYGEQVLISYDFASDRIEYPRFEEIEPALFFQYDDFAYSLRDRCGELEEVILKINFSIPPDHTETRRACYYPCDFNMHRACAYTGTEIYVNDELRAFSDELLMYDIYDVQDLKEKIYSYSEVQK